MSNLFLSDNRKMAYVRQLKVKCGRSGREGDSGTMIAMGPSYVTVNHFFNYMGREKVLFENFSKFGYVLV